MTLRRYDLKPSKEIPDSLKFEKPLMATLPQIVDLTGYCSPIQNQENIGSCTAHAMSGMLEYIELRDFRKGLTMQIEEFAGIGLQHPSRLFIYYNERLIEGNPNQDSGSSISDSIQSVVKYGFCNENIWVYDTCKIFNQPDHPAYEQAYKHRCKEYRQLSLYDVQPCLASGHPFIIGFQVYQSFESPYVSYSGVVPMPGFGERYLGGHAVLVVGYDDPKQQFICRNSWGTSWGMNGYFRLPYQYLADSKLASDFWTVLK